MPVTEAQKRATAKYERENYDKILTRFPKGTKEKILSAGAVSVNSFIVAAVNERLEKYNQSNTAKLNDLQALIDAKAKEHNQYNQAQNGKLDF